MATAPWLEDDLEFEGVGAHYLNPRYDVVDEEPDHRPRAGTVLRAPRLTRIFSAVGSYPLDGHDGSHHQWDAGVAAGATPPVDLDVLAAFTWIIWWKATQSTRYADPTFLYVWARRRAFKMALAYHWLSSTTDPEQQADHFLQIIGDLGPGDGMMLDAEEYGITPEGCLAFCEYCEKRWKRPVSVYSGLYVSGGRIWKSDALRESHYGLRPFHVAAYVLRESLLARIAATGSQNYPYHAWQFSSNGPVAGIISRADMNTEVNRLFYQTATGLIVPPFPTPTPTPIPSPGDEDEMDLYTNREADDEFGPAYPTGGYSVFELIAGSKRRVSWEEYQMRGWPALEAKLIPVSNDLLRARPDYVPPGTQTPTPSPTVKLLRYELVPKE